MALKNYSATVLTGGGSGALDSIDGANLKIKIPVLFLMRLPFIFIPLMMIPERLKVLLMSYLLMLMQVIKGGY